VLATMQCLLHYPIQELAGAYELRRQMTNEDLQLLWMNGTCSRPESLLTVSPEPIHPSVQQATGGGSPEDDIPVKLQEIIEMMRNIMHY